jgi:crotonobetainyl-CoA:carnitine CoA-transferase CaiB-like acyl-CoA transferase
MSITGTPESAPLKVGPPVIDYSTGIAAAYAVSAALYQRTHTGKGQHIDLSMLDTTMVLMASVVTAYLNTGAAPKPAGNDASSRAPASTTYNTADGLLALAINEEHQYQHLLLGLGLQALNNDPRFTEPAARRDNVPALRAALQQALMTRAALEWETLLNELGVPAGRVRTVPECLADEQIAARGLFHTFPAAETGLARDFKVPLAPFRFEHGGPKADTPPRPVGADTDAILKELGYAAADMQRLRARGVI